MMPCFPPNRKPRHVDAGNTWLQAVADDVAKPQFLLVGIIQTDPANFVRGAVLGLHAQHEIAAGRVREGRDVGEELPLILFAGAYRVRFEVEEAALKRLVLAEGLDICEVNVGEFFVSMQKSSP